MHNHKGFSPILLIIIVAVAGISFISGISFNKFVSPKKTEIVTKNSDVKSPDHIEPTSSVQPNTKHTNQRYNFSFDLKGNERVATCDEMVRDPVSSVYKVTTLPLPATPDQEIVCIGGDATPLYVINVHKIGVVDYFIDSVDDYVAQLETDYALKKSEVTISGVKAIRVAGSLKEGAPLPDKVDKIIFTNNGNFYDVDAIYLDRNFSLLSPNN